MPTAERVRGGGRVPPAAVALPPCAVCWAAAMGSLAGILQAQGALLGRALTGATVGLGLATVLVAHAGQVAKARTILALVLVVAARGLSRMDWPAGRDQPLRDQFAFLVLLLGTGLRLCLGDGAAQRTAGCDPGAPWRGLGRGGLAQLEHGIVERVDQRPPSARDREGVAGSEHDVAQIIVQREPQRAGAARHVERSARRHFEQVAAQHGKAAGVVKAVHGGSPMQDADDYTEGILGPPMVIRHATHAASECEQRA